MSSYSPCRHGIHVCGMSADETEPVTLGNFHGASLATFESVRDDFALPGDENPDMMIDFMCDGDIIHDFGMRRQDLTAMIAIIGAETYST